MTDRDPIPILDVEERLRVCLTLTKGLYHYLEIAGEHARARLDNFQPRDVLNQVPELTRALRDQLLAVRAALPFECRSRPAPLTVPPAQRLPDAGERPDSTSDSGPDAPTTPTDRASQARRRRSGGRRRARIGGAQ